jgi:dihydroorotate dehydrogenase
MPLLFALSQRALLALDAERAHGLTLSALRKAQRCGVLGLFGKPPAPMPVTVAGIEFVNPVGLAAGCDKNGEAIDAWFGLGFGFVEIGTVTPKAQAGNPRPRMFRLRAAQAVINRLGFNNGGLDLLVHNVQSRRSGGKLGINLGKNKDTPNEQAASDYLTGMQRCYALADYLTINISSPNTAGLRDLQSRDALRALLGELKSAQIRLSGVHGRQVPLFVKLAPDLDAAALDEAAAVILDSGIEGAILGNTTLDRSTVTGLPHAQEAGGLSGAPLMARSTTLLAEFRARVGPGLALIGVGGISQGADAVAKFAAGANLVQFYTGLVYRGPALIGDCVEALRASPHHAGP